MDNEQYYKEAMNKLTDPEDKEDLESCWERYKDEGSYNPVNFKKGVLGFCEGFLCWEFPQWLEATCINPRIRETLSLTGKHLLKIQLLCRLRDLNLPKEEVEQWTDLITKDNVNDSKIDLALKYIQVNERKQALTEDFKQV